MLGDIIIYYDADVCDVKTLVENYLQMFEFLEKDAMLAPYKIIQNMDEVEIRLSERGDCIRFKSIGNYCRGFKPLMGLIPEHMKNSQCVQCDILPTIRSDFVAYYDQKNFVKE